jgi:hypothetical protein
LSVRHAGTNFPSYTDLRVKPGAADGAYEFFFRSVPLKVPGGVGSPPNALAIK